MITLLDVNVLLALGDLGHEHAEAAVRFFEREAVPEGWATCPLTENAFLRILSHPNHPRSQGSPAVARRLLDSLRAAPGHVFWPDDISLLDTGLFPALPLAKDLTDIYLLGLAMKNGGRFATFDRTVPASLVPGGPSACHVIAV